MPTDPQPTRRGLLHLIGLGTGTVAVLGAAGLTGRAVAGGVFSTGTGPAYAAWDAAETGSGPYSLVRAAILAASAHNAQPWLFTVGAERIELRADLTRTLGAMDPAQRELHLSLGCAVENLALAAPAHGLTPDVTLMPDPSDPTHVATIALTAGPTRSSALYEAIADRHTDRNAYDRSRSVDDADLAALGALVEADTRLVWFRSPSQKQSFSDLTVRATQAIIDDSDMARDDHRWYRSTWSELEDHRDGITIDPSGQSQLIRAVSKLVPTSRAQDDAGWLSGTRDTQLPTAAAFGALVVSLPGDDRQRLEAGRTWQRLHLTATTLGLSVQPLCQIPERIDREATAGLDPDVTTAMADLLPNGQHALMTFRIGHPTTEVLRSPRRPVSDVVRRASTRSAA